MDAEERGGGGISRRALVRGLGAAALAGAMGAAAGCGAAAVELPVVELETARSSAELVGKSDAKIRKWVRSTVYDVAVQADIAAEIEAAKAAGAYTLASPLAIYNPFGTNTLGIYFYFCTDEACSITYTVSVSAAARAAMDDETLTAAAIPSFTRTPDGGARSTEHEFLLMGLVRGAVNTIAITATAEDGAEETARFTYEMGAVLGDEELQLALEEGGSEEALADGLYAILGNDGTDSDELRCLYLYDNEGFLRAETPIQSYRAHRLLFADGFRYYSISGTKMAAVNELGQVVAVYPLGRYKLHHDYVWGPGGLMLLLATDTQAETVEDMVVSLDPATGEVALVVDMGDLLPAYKEAALAYHEAFFDAERDASIYEGDVAGTDWMHLNTIQWVEDKGALIVSSRETSSIIQIEDAFGEPRLGYLLASAAYWEGTGYEDHVFAQVGSFTVHGGQHAVTYEPDEALEPGQSYLSLFNNNIGVSEAVTSGFDYASVGLTESAATSDTASSYYYRYLVDEDAGTFELVEALEVPYSGFVSSVQHLDGGGGNLVVDSGNVGVFAEYDEDLELIRRFSMATDKFIYRVFKYDL